MKALVRVLAFIVALGAFTALPVEARHAYPDRIELPDGFQPEGIAIDRRGTFYVGSIPTGDIYSGSLRSGEGDILVDAEAGRAAIGLSLDRYGRLFVAGGSTGAGYVYDARTGEDLAAYQFTAAGAGTFVNDVVVTRDAAWFTDSRQAVLYKVPLGDRGALPAPDGFEVVPLTGDFVLDPAAFNLNGIDATRDGETLVVVQSGPGLLFTVDADSGVTSAIDLGGETVANGDGILLDGRRLYVVQNRLNLVAKIWLDRDLSSGEVVSRTTDEDFDVPTTVAEFGRSLYLVNARFGTAGAQPADYWITRIDRP